MRAIIVDDEALALRSMEKVLNELGGVEVVGKFQNPHEVITAMTLEKPDVLFLDIEMPGMNGMKLAEKLMQIEPELNIVFVTAYRDYAVEAFDLDVLDYIVKPIRHDRVARTLQRMRDRIATDSTKAAVDSAMIRCFRALQIEYPGKEPEFIQWRTNKAQELFAYLLHHAGIPVRKDVLIDILWPNLAVERAYNHLYTTMYQLRKTLSSLQLKVKITSGDDGYMLDKGEIRVDAELWENNIRHSTRVSAETIDEHRRSMQLYRGAYLQEYDYTWVVDERERLSMLWYHHAIQIADYLMLTGQYAETISLCHEIREQQPYSGYSYHLLMRIYAILGDRAMVKEQYQRLVLLLMQDLGESPEMYIIEWYTNWESQQ